jgi:hypothetical protein
MGREAITTIAAVRMMPAATAKAVVYPNTSAAAGSEVPAFAVTAAAMAARTASPTAPPTCWLVLNTPDARPWSSSRSSEVAVIVNGTNDLAGAILITASLALLIYAVTEANRYGWLSARTVGCGGTSLLLIAAFLATEARLVAPLVPLSI